MFEHDLPDLSIKGWSVTAVEVSYAPGESSAPHHHPGITIAYILEGEVRSKVGDDPEKTYTACVPVPKECDRPSFPRANPFPPRYRAGQAFQHA